MSCPARFVWQGWLLVVGEAEQERTVWADEVDVLAGVWRDALGGLGIIEAGGEGDDVIGTWGQGNHMDVAIQLAGFPCLRGYPSFLRPLVILGEKLNIPSVVDG